MKLMMLIFSLLVGLQASAYEVAPSATAPGIYDITGNHIVLVPPQSNGRLLLTISGTNSRAIEYKNVQEWGRDLGFTVLGIDYPNMVICTTCREASDLTCFDKYREEIMLGNPVSDIVNVNRANSILNRIQSLMKYLVKTEGLEKWKAFLNPDQSINWNKVVVTGYSQGAGHAAYLGKIFALKGVVMVGGPHDSWKKGSAPWLYRKGATPPEKYTSFLHEKDFFGSEYQAAAARALMNNNSIPMTKIHSEIEAGSTAQIYVSDLPFHDPHISLALPVYKDVWDFLLRRLME